MLGWRLVVLPWVLIAVGLVIILLAAPGGATGAFVLGICAIALGGLGVAFARARTPAQGSSASVVQPMGPIGARS